MDESILKPVVVNSDNEAKEKEDEEINYFDAVLLSHGFRRRNMRMFCTMSKYIGKELTAKRFENGRALFNRKGLVLSGDIGVGKTTAVKVFAEEFEYTFKTIAELAEIRVSYNDDAFRATIANQDFFEKYQPLIIDDLGTEPLVVKQFGTEMELGSDIINQRYEVWKDFGATTIITTNLTQQQLSERYGQRSSDRLKEMCHFVYIKGTSLRGQE